MAYKGDELFSSVACLSFSLSGRFLFTGHEDYLIRVWDTLRGEELYGLSAHENVVSALGMNLDGTALASASWDYLLAVWA